MGDVIININVDGEDVKINKDAPKIKKSKTKHGRKAVLELPVQEPNSAPVAPVLDMMGI